MFHKRAIMYVYEQNTLTDKHFVNLVVKYSKPLIMIRNIFIFTFIALVFTSCMNNNTQEASPATSNSDVMYYFNTYLEGTSLDSAIVTVTEALKKEGFGVISTINIQEKIKEKLGKDFRPYIILGACSPQHAYEALNAEDKIGTMLPCNVIIQEAGEGRYEVAAVNPIASMQAIKNEKLGTVAQEVTVKLKKVISDLDNTGK